MIVISSDLLRPAEIKCAVCRATSDASRCYYDRCSWCNGEIEISSRGVAEYLEFNYLGFYLALEDLRDKFTFDRSDLCLIRELDWIIELHNERSKRLKGLFRHVFLNMFSGSVKEELCILLNNKPSGAFFIIKDMKYNVLRFKAVELCKYESEKRMMEEYEEMLVEEYPFSKIFSLIDRMERIIDRYDAKLTYEDICHIDFFKYAILCESSVSRVLKHIEESFVCLSYSIAFMWLMMVECVFGFMKKRWTKKCDRFDHIKLSSSKLFCREREFKTIAILIFSLFLIGIFSLLSSCIFESDPSENVRNVRR